MKKSSSAWWAATDTATSWTGFDPMWAPVAAIVWAQFRTARNHLPRSSAGSLLMALLSIVWYGGFVALAWFLSMALSVAPFDAIHQWLGLGLLGAFLFWQIVPLLTLTGGWSLHLKKLQVYPIPTGALFGIEAVLRITTGLEMLMLLLGASIGLMRHPQIPMFAPLFLLLFVPLNLFLSLAVREFLLHSFKNNRLRELFAVLVVSIGLLPQVFLRSGLGEKVKPYLFAVANLPGAPWHELARLSAGDLSILPVLFVTVCIALSYFLARWQFSKALIEEDSLRGNSSGMIAPTAGAKPLKSMLEIPSRCFADPLAALIEKEIRTLLRMPRFRVIFGLACFFSVFVFAPFVFGEAGNTFVQHNFPAVANIYGLLMLGDALLWNIFGFDRSAAQTYFVSPVALKTVFQAKNLTAIVFMFAQSVIVLLVAIIFRFPITRMNLLLAVCSSAVAGVFFLAAGNLSSVTIPRPIDPTQTLRKQGGAQAQIWLAGCALGMSALMGLGFLARWAMQSDWALIAVLVIESAIGCIVFKVATDSAVERGIRDREKIMNALASGASQLAL